MATKPEREAQVRAAVEGLVTAILGALEDAQPARDLPDQLLSIDQAAATLGIGRSRLYEELGRGRLRSFKVGRRRLIPSGALAEFIAARSND